MNEKCLKSAKCFNYSCNNYFKASTLFEGPVYHTVCNVLNLMIFIMEQILKSSTNILMFLQTSLSCHVVFFSAVIKQFLLDVCWGDLDYQSDITDTPSGMTTM